MCRFIETIKIIDGKPVNIEFHQKRVNETLRKFFGSKTELDLQNIFETVGVESKKLLKCKIVYSKSIHTIQINEYKKKIISEIRLVNSGTLIYNYKFENRDELNSLLKKSLADEVIIIKNNHLADTSYSNIVFQDGNKFLTPSTPLLNGTKRQKLLSDGLIIEAELLKSDLKFFSYFYLINAMLDIEESNRLPIGIIKI